MGRLRLATFVVGTVMVLALSGCSPTHPPSSSTQPAVSTPAVLTRPAVVLDTVAIKMPPGSVGLPAGWRVVVDNSQAFVARSPKYGPETPEQLTCTQGGRPLPPGPLSPAYVSPEDPVSAITPGVLFSKPCHIRSRNVGLVTITSAWRDDGAFASLALASPELNDFTTATAVFASLGIKGRFAPMHVPGPSSHPDVPPARPPGSHYVPPTRSSAMSGSP